MDWRGSLIRRFSNWAGERAVDGDWAGLVDAWRASYAPAMDRVRRGERPWASLDVLHGEALDALLPRFDLTLAPPERAWFVHGWHELDPWPDVPAALERLRTGFTTATLSNGHLGLQIDLTKHGDLRFDALFSAETFGHYKPDPQAYLGAARLLGLAPRDVMLCAAHPSDLDGAAACGLQTAFIRRPLEYGPAAASMDTGGEARFDVVAGDLALFARRMLVPTATKSP